MDLKKLYGDVTVLLKREVPIYEFLASCDLGVRTLLCRYQKKLIVGKGEYIAPEDLNSSVALDGAFYPFLLYFIIGTLCSDEKMLEKSRDEAQNAYKMLWRAAARGKHIKNDRW